MHKTELPTIENLPKHITTQLEIQKKPILAKKAPKKIIKTKAVVTTKHPSKRGLQCVQLARQLSGIKIHGNANTWVRQAKAKGMTVNNTPTIGAVLSEPKLSKAGHVSVVIAVSNGYATVKEANYVAGHITIRKVPITGTQQFIQPK